MKPYCEVVVASILPVIRSVMTRELLTKYNMTQQEAANLLGITQAAVSHYNKQSRGSKVKLLEKEEDIMKMIDDLTKNIVDKKIDAKGINKGFCEICKNIRKKHLICKIHEDIYPSIAPCQECNC